MRNMIFKTESKFLILGFLNFVITNIVLQLMLGFYSIYVSTFISQVVNLIIGYILYGKFVFGVQRSNNSSFLKYICLAILSWQLNSLSISILFNKFLISKKIAALLMIPVLTILSFSVQKKYVFSKK